MEGEAPDRSKRQIGEIVSGEDTGQRSAETLRRLGPDRTTAIAPAQGRDD